MPRSRFSCGGQPQTGDRGRGQAAGRGQATGHGQTAGRGQAAGCGQAAGRGQEAGRVGCRFLTAQPERALARARINRFAA